MTETLYTYQIFEILVGYFVIHLISLQPTTTTHNVNGRTLLRRLLRRQIRLRDREAFKITPHPIYPNFVVELDFLGRVRVNLT
jgi:hypothetical protein